jgi:hypothetical protein
LIMKPTDEPLATAPSYAGLGLATFPVRGKAPLTDHGFKDASKDPAQLAAWLAQYRNAGIAAPTGQEIEPGRRVAVVDRDERHGGSFAGLDIPPTWRAITPGGEHVWYWYPAGLTISCNNTGLLGPGLDLKAVGGYVVLPPSPHPSGERYRWAPGCAPWETPLSPAPKWVLERATMPKTEGARRSGSEWASLFSNLGEGNRDIGLTTLAGILFRELDPMLAYQLLHVTNEARCKPPLSSEQVDKIASSIGGREARKLRRSRS